MGAGWDLVSGIGDLDHLKVLSVSERGSSGGVISLGLNHVSVPTFGERPDKGCLPQSENDWHSKWLTTVVGQFGANSHRV